jgi:hypothetical protein
VLWKIEQGISMFHVKYEDNKYIMVQVIGLIETKDWATRTQLKAGDELRCSGR